jgi:ketosteroid isomerase-like protein
MKTTLLIALLIFSATVTVIGQKNIDQRIRQLDSERIQAQINADTVALKRIYSDDFIGVGPSGTVRTKPQVISDFTSGELKFQSITTDEVQVRVYGNTAVETGKSTMIGQDKDKVVPRDNRFTRVWVKLMGVGNWFPIIIRCSLLSNKKKLTGLLFSSCQEKK